jgi:hypothetical protein
LVEFAVELEDLAQQDLVKDIGDVAAMCFENRHGRFDDVGLLVRQRRYFTVKSVPIALIRSSLLPGNVNLVCSISY